MFIEKEQQDLKEIIFLNCRVGNFVNEEVIWTEDVGGMTDILRYEIVYQFGGIYADTDSVCSRPFTREFLTSYVSHEPWGYKNICAGNFAFPKVRVALLFYNLFHPVLGFFFFGLHIRIIEVKLQRKARLW